MRKCSTRTVGEFLRKRRGRSKVIAGIVMLAVSVPVFLLYHAFPTINAEIGPHQIASWLAVTLSFVGFISLIMGAGELDL